MGKYIVEVAYTVTYVKTFEVDASNQQDAIDKAEQEAYDTDMRTGSAGTPEVEGEIMEAPEDRGECPECGSKLRKMLEGVEGVDEEELTNSPRYCECGWHE